MSETRRPLVTPPHITTEKYKQALKERCLQRVRGERAALLARLRGQWGSPISTDGEADVVESGEKGALTLVARSILDAGLKEDRRKENSEDHVSMCDLTANDCEYEHDSMQCGAILEGDEDSQQHESRDKRRRMVEVDSDDFLGGLSSEEHVEMMVFIEKALSEELHRGENETLALQSYESVREREEQEIALAVAALEDGCGWQEDEVLCPICRSNWLLQSGCVVFCACGFRLDTGETCQKLLGYVKQCLADVFAQHRQRCRKEPTFSVKEDFGSVMLWGECNACGFGNIVL